MNKKTILISVDHKWRDLAGYVYAKILLEKFGYRVVLIRHGFEEYYADVLNPKAVVMIHLYDKNRNRLIRKLKRRNILVILMPTEGIPTLEGVRKLAAGCFSDLSDIDLHFLWNNEMRELMEQTDTIDPEKLCVIGVPRFDFYTSALKNALMSRSEFITKYGLDGRNPIITWATNFTNASFHVKNSEFLREDWKKLQVDKVFNPQEVAAKDYASRQLLFNSVIKLVKNMSNVSLVIKLHPSEDHTFYYEKIKEMPVKLRERVRVINREYIWDVLNATDILLKRSCTVGIEAWLLHKPTIELRLNPDEWYYSKEHAAGSDEVHTDDELCGCVSHYLNGGSIPAELVEHRNDFIRKWCYQVDGESTLRFTSRIHELIKRDSRAVSKEGPLSLRFFKSCLIVVLMEAVNFRIHNLKVYGLKGKLDKLGRYDKYFDRSDERYWIDEISTAIT